MNLKQMIPYAFEQFYGVQDRQVQIYLSTTYLGNLEIKNLRLHFNPSVRL